MAIRSRLRRRLCTEAGFGLIELMVAIVMTMVVFLAVSNWWGISYRNQDDIGNRVEILAEARAGLEYMTRELRQAQVSAPGAGATSEWVDLYLPNNNELVRFDCSEGTECRRLAAPPGGTLAPSHDPLIANVEGASFNRAEFRYIEIELVLDIPDRDQAIVLTDGVHLRNGQGT